jgi:hypothetical protein
MGIFFRQELERDAASQLGVFGPKYDTHPTLAKLFHDPVMGYFLADLGHGGLREGDSTTATKSTGIAAIIGQMIEIKKAQSRVLGRIALIHKLLSWPEIDS